MRCGRRFDRQTYEDATVEQDVVTAWSVVAPCIRADSALRMTQFEELSLNGGVRRRKYSLNYSTEAICDS